MIEWHRTMKVALKKMWILPLYIVDGCRALIKGYHLYLFIYIYLRGKT
ncbi:hypothetical protein MtrunA17_Chr2g0334091 [Medicago truncatula]|uniref:Transmembrane protein n=1 Tax=Medicago truncatula TaxID=3880 RepID=A0A396JH50_MEDTR|nr:hypothetical protein MtrunA17_Chr2g0334091 [Medicago truncatula]